MSDSTHVFISHAAGDIGTARALTRTLRKIGVEVWSPTDINIGDEIEDTVWKRLEEADIVVFLITAGSVQSPWTAAEFGAGLALKKRILPVVIGDVTPDQIPFRLKRLKMLYVESKAEVPRKVAEFLASAVAA